MATAIEYVGAGASGTANGANPTATLPSGLADDDLMVAFFYSREGTDGTVSISAGWTQIINDLSSAGLLAVWYRFRVTGDVAPTITVGNHAAGDDVFIQIAAWRGVDPSTPIDNIGVVTDNAAAVDIGPLPTMPVGRKVLVIAFGGKQDDWTSVATLTTDGDLTWAEIGEPDSTTGNDAGMVWDYAVNPGLETNVSATTFDVVGGGSQPGKGVIISFNLDADAFAAATDLVLYCAQSHPYTDSASPGGAIDPYMRAIFTDLAANDDIEAVSDDTGDTAIFGIARGRNSSGELVEETKQLNGTTAVIFSTLGLIDDMLDFRLTEPAVGNITVRRSVAGTTIAVIPAGELGFRRIFFGAYSHPNNAKDYYEKIFLKNVHPVTTLQTVSVSESADPGALVTFTLAASIDDEAYSDSRLEAPDTGDTDPDTFDATAKDIPGSGSNLDPDSAIGIWLKLTVVAAAAATKNTYTLQIDGGVAP